MLNKKVSILIFGAVIFSGSAFASVQETKLNYDVNVCVSDISRGDMTKSFNGVTLFEVQYGEKGGVHKYCSSIASTARKVIGARHESYERMLTEFNDTFKAIHDLPDRNSPYGIKLTKKLMVLNNKLEGRTPNSKLYFYRAFMDRINKLDALLPKVAGH